VGPLVRHVGPSVRHVGQYKSMRNEMSDVRFALMAHLMSMDLKSDSEIRSTP
jgi:hypothetical protein